MISKGAMILMADRSSKPVEELAAGDQIITPLGVTTVTKAVDVPWLLHDLAFCRIAGTNIQCQYHNFPSPTTHNIMSVITPEYLRDSLHTFVFGIDCNCFLSNERYVFGNTTSFYVMDQSAPIQERAIEMVSSRELDTMKIYTKNNLMIVDGILCSNHIRYPNKYYVESFNWSEFVNGYYQD